MSSDTPSIPITYGVKPSLRFAVLLLLSHAIVTLVVYAILTQLVAKSAMLILILLSLLFYLSRDVLLLFPGSWREISFNQDSILIVTRDGSGLSGKLISSTTVSPYFAVVRVMLQGRRLSTSWTVFPDSLDTGQFRELCVYLKFSQ